MNDFRNKRVVLWFLTCTLLAGFAHGARSIEPWQPIFRGVLYTTAETDTPRLQKITVIRIDLQDPDIRFLGTPADPSVPYPYETSRETGSQFMARYPVQIAVNSHYYTWNGDLANLEGLAISEGSIVSPLTDEWPIRKGTMLITQDNVVTFMKTYPDTDVSGYWTAVETRDGFILKTGTVYTWGDTSIHPRTAVGVSQDGRYMIVMTIDGRQTGYSEGATLAETAQWLIDFGAYDGLNLDGGGSTHLLMSDGAGGSITLNSPSENREVASHLGVYAAPLPEGPVHIYADFEDGVETPFTTSLTYSGTTYGILAGSAADATDTDSFSGGWSQVLTLYDDPAADDGWLVRHLSGAGSPSQNDVRPAAGTIGFWARTSASGVKAAVAVDDLDNGTSTELAVFRTLIGDGQWHLYEWNLEDAAQWDVWVGGNGIIDTEDFTLDSIQFMGPDSDAVIYLDRVMHSSHLSLSDLYDVPITEDLIIHLRADMLELNNGDSVLMWPDMAADDAVDGTVSVATGQDAPVFKPNVVNGRPVVRFTDDVLCTQNGGFDLPIPSEGVTVFAVFTGDSSGDTGERLGQIGHTDGTEGKVLGMDASINTADADGGSGFRFNNGRALAKSTNPLTTGFHVGVWQMDQNAEHSTAAYYVDGEPITLDNINNPANTLKFPTGAGNTELSLGTGKGTGGGWQASDFYEGDLAEILVYNAQLTAAQVQSITDSLNQKYKSTAAHNPLPGNNNIEQGVLVGEVQAQVTFGWDTGLDPDTGLPNPDITRHYLYVAADVPDFSGVTPITISAGSPVAASVSSGPIVLGTNTTYYWRVDESINGSAPGAADTITGPLWSFTTVESLPIINEQPAAQKVLLGQTATFTIDVTSFPPANFRWYRSADNTNDTPADDTFRGNTQNLTISGVQSSDEGYYYCKVFNASGAENAVYSDAAMLMVKRIVAHWTMDWADYVSGHYLDSSGQDHHAAPAVLPDAGSFVDGADATETGQGLDLTVQPQAAARTEPFAATAFSGETTVSAWVKWNGSNADWQGIVNNRAAPVDPESGTNFQIQVEPGGTIRINLSGSVLYTATALPTDAWSNLVVSASPDELAVYLNGEPAAVDPAVPGIPLNQNVLPVYLGALSRDADALTGIFNGAIDDVRIYNYGMDRFGVMDLYYDVTETSFCLKEITFDVAGGGAAGDEPDCMVNLDDLAAFTAQWLNCGLYPQNACP